MADTKHIDIIYNVTYDVYDTKSQLRPRLSDGGGGGVVSGSGTAERGSTGTDFSYLRPCLNGGLAGGGLAGVIRSEGVPDDVLLLSPADLLAVHPP